MSVPWWVQTIFSALWDQNENRIKTNENPPNPKKAARRNARSLTEHTDPNGGDKHGTPVFNAHPTLLSTVCVSSYSSTDQMGDLRNGQAIQTIFPASTRLPFPFISSSRLESVSSTKEVLLMKQDFHNTDLASSKPCCVQFTQRGRGREGSLMEL